MKIGDLVRYTDTYDNFNIGVGSIGLIVGDILVNNNPKRTGSFYHVLFGDKKYTLPFHHIEEIK